jgi:hypothetical protein
MTKREKTPFDHDYPPAAALEVAMRTGRAESRPIDIRDFYRRPAPTLEILGRRIDVLEREVHELRQQRLGVRLRRGWQAAVRWWWGG